MTSQLVNGGWTLKLQAGPPGVGLESYAPRFDAKHKNPLLLMNTLATYTSTILQQTNHVSILRQERAFQPVFKVTAKEI